MSRQTISYLQRKFAEVGLEPNARHGQNFLIDLNLLDFLARTADVQNRDVVLEVGTGTASLTTRLAELAGHVVTVEIDQHLYGLAQEQLSGQRNVTMLQIDALRNKNHIHDDVLQAVRTALQSPQLDQFKLVANLPYNIATPILANLLAGDLLPNCMTVTIQKELAERIVAQPGTRDYSALSVWLQSFCDVSIERILAPSVFWPRPKVQSAIIHVVPHASRRDIVPDLVWYQSFVRSIFQHRRKLLRGVLLASFKKSHSKETIDKVLAQLHFPENARADSLTVPQLQELSENMRVAVSP